MHLEGLVAPPQMSKMLISFIPLEKPTLHKQVQQYVVKRRAVSCMFGNELSGQVRVQAQGVQ